jgi:protein phosphatase
MRPILQTHGLTPGTTLYHSAFGFARVEAADDDGVTLAWERDGGHLPRKVRNENLRRVYSVCGADGFFHRAVVNKDALRTVLHERPADALVWLLDDLAAPQRLRDIMDWLVGRELFTAKTFVRWWGSAESLVKSDPRLSLEGEWLHLRNESAPAMVQLEPTAVASEAEQMELTSIVQRGPLEEEVEVHDHGTDEVAIFVPLAPVPLAEAAPPPRALAALGRAMAEALATCHGEGRVANPTSESSILNPDGSIRFEDNGPSSAPWAEEPSPEADVRAAAVVLLEVCLGRSLPAITDPAEILPHVRHRVPDLPPAALAPLFSAMRASPAQRPTALAWARQWASVQAAELDRPRAYDPQAHVRVGYDSHIGRVKLLLSQTNQDALFVGVRGNHALLVLADGISIADAGRGDIASWLAVQAIARMWQAVPAERIVEQRLLDRALHLANRAICDHALRAAGGDLTGRMPMGTTLTAAVLSGNRVHLAWLGDSRAYLAGPWGVSLLTADDNVSGERFLSWCDADARAWSSDGHALVRYLGHFDEGAQPAPFPAHHTSFVLRSDERLVLCTDGITDYVDPREGEVADRIHHAAMSMTPDAACRALVNAANERGGGDNATMIIAEADDRGVELW